MSKIIRPIEIIRPYKRNGNFPIDTTSVYYSLSAAESYVQTNPSAYPGQLISVVENEEVNIYKIAYDEHENLKLEPIDCMLVEFDNDTQELKLIASNGTVLSSAQLPTGEAVNDITMETGDNELLLHFTNIDGTTTTRRLHINLESPAISVTDYYEDDGEIYVTKMMINNQEYRLASSTADIQQIQATLAAYQTRIETIENSESEMESELEGIKNLTLACNLVNSVVNNNEVIDNITDIDEHNQKYVLIDGGHATFTREGS